MALDQRKLVQLGTAARASAVLPRIALGATGKNDAFEAQFADTLDRLRAAYAAFGFAESQPLSISTGDTKNNGGLRHDFDQDALPTNGFIIQPLDWTEIGEIIFGGEVALLGISIGAERLTYARTGQFPTWDQRLGALFALAAQERKEPPGLAAFC